MKNIFKILFSLTILIGVFSCEKQIICPNDMDTHSNTRSVVVGGFDENDCVTDPDEDEDFDGVDEVVIDNVTDPDEDEDFDSEEVPGTQN